MPIRPLVSDDIERIREIDALCFVPEERYETKVYEQMPLTGESVAALENELVVAYAFVQQRPRGPGLHVRSIAVHPNFQRQGHAKALLREIISRSNGAVDLLVDPSNQIAITLYTQLGFIPEERCEIPGKNRMTRIPG